ncbi:MAG: hypothetical protein V4642_10995 [Bacteroidota bacterium]
MPIEIEILESQLETAMLAEERIEALLKLSRSLYQSDVARAFALSREAKKLAEENDNYSGIAQSLLGFAGCFIISADYIAAAGVSITRKLVIAR